MERYFNIVRPCLPAKHTMLPELDRLPGIRRMINREQYFVVHAPRLTSKMTALKSSADSASPIFPAKLKITLAIWNKLWETLRPKRNVR